MRYKYIIFDLDGTLINSTHKIIDIIEDYFFENYPELYDTARYYLEYSQGQSLQEQLENIFKDKKIAEKETKKLYSILSSLRDKIHFFPGVQKKIKELNHKGYLLFLTTGSSTEFATKTLKNGGIYKYFEKVIGSDKILKGKKHHKIFKEITNDDKFLKNSLYIGDGEMDKIFAQESGIDFIRVGFRGKKDEKRIKSVIEIDTIL